MIKIISITGIKGFENVEVCRNQFNILAGVVKNMAGLRTIKYVENNHQRMIQV